MLSFKNKYSHSKLIYQRTLFINPRLTLLKKSLKMVMYWLLCEADTKKSLFLIFDLFLFFSVRGQSISVTPNPAISVIGESIDISWTITKVDQSDVIVTARLYLGTSFASNKLLYQDIEPLTKQDLANKMFGERIHASFKESNYKLTLNKLNINDSANFTLVVNQEIIGTLKARPVLKKSVEVIVVTGMKFFFKTTLNN